MVAVQTTISTSDVRLSTQDTLLQHLEVIVEGMKTSHAFHIVALNGDNRTRTIYSLEDESWCVLSERPLQDSDWYPFMEEPEEEPPPYDDRTVEHVYDP